MHELTLVESVIDEITAHGGDAHVAVVRLEVGELAGIENESLRFCFEVCAAGTVVADAELDIAPVPARARCRACGRSWRIHTLGGTCTCGSADQALESGDEARLKEIEVS